MSAADDERARRDEARRWLAVADEDLATVGACLAAAPPLPKSAAYHCQQAIEKLIKGLLVLAGVAFRKTHDLRGLTLQAAPLYPELEAMKRDLRWLTVWGFAYRYPMEEPEETPPTADDVRGMVGRIREFREALAKRVDVPSAG